MSNNRWLLSRFTAGMLAVACMSENAAAQDHVQPPPAAPARDAPPVADAASQIETLTGAPASDLRKLGEETQRLLLTSISDDSQPLNSSYTPTSVVMKDIDGPATWEQGARARCRDDAALARAERDALIALMESRTAAAQHTVWAFSSGESTVTATNWIGYLIAATVHVMLGFGAWAAWQEFKHARSRRSRDTAQAPLDLTIRADGVALKSAMTGVVLVLVSMAFYFMYIRFVLPISAI